MRIISRICALALVGLALGGAPAAAIGVIRDPEIEQTLHRIADPIFRVASLSPARVHMYIVNDPEMNAFVAGGQNIFVNTGMLTRLDSIDQLRAVLAHEVGHITNGDFARQAGAMKGPATMQVIGMLGAAAAVLGGSPQAGVAIATGSQQVAQRTALAYSRGEESSADAAGIGYLADAGGNPGAMLEVLHTFEGQEALSALQLDPYVQTHPLSSDRIAMIEGRVAKLPKGNPPAPEDVYWYHRMVAKLNGFLNNPSDTLAKYPAADGSELATLSRAIAYHRRPDPAKANAQVDVLIAIRPDDPFYHELKGQILLETGHAAPAAQAYRRAVALAPNQPLILGGLGRALLNMDDPATTAEARDALARSASMDRQDPDVLRDLALAEARLGHEGQAALATAERFLLANDFPDALRNANHAAAVLPTGSPGWLRAQDMISMAQRAMKKR